MAVRASASVSKEKNSIHCLTEIDIADPRERIKIHFEKTGEKLSLTGYIVSCLADTIKKNPELNSFQKGHRQIILDDLTISVFIEREIKGEKVPEPIGIQNAQNKSYFEIKNEIRAAQKVAGDKLGNLSESAWIRFIPSFLLRAFIRFADKNIKMAKKYGKVAVTAVGMYSKSAVWFIPTGTATVLLTIGGINEKVIQRDGTFVACEHLCLTISFDHNIVDGAPAARFIRELSETIRSATLLE